MVYRFIGYMLSCECYGSESRLYEAGIRLKAGGSCRKDTRYGCENNKTFARKRLARACTSQMENKKLLHTGALAREATAMRGTSPCALCLLLPKRSDSISKRDGFALISSSIVQPCVQCGAAALGWLIGVSSCGYAIRRPGRLEILFLACQRFAVCGCRCDS